MAFIKKHPKEIEYAAAYYCSRSMLNVVLTISYQYNWLQYKPGIRTALSEISRQKDEEKGQSKEEKKKGKVNICLCSVHFH